MQKKMSTEEWFMNQPDHEGGNHKERRNPSRWAPKKAEHGELDQSRRDCMQQAPLHAELQRKTQQGNKRLIWTGSPSQESKTIPRAKTTLLQSKEKAREQCNSTRREGRYWSNRKDTIKGGQHNPAATGNKCTTSELQNCSRENPPPTGTRLRNSAKWSQDGNLRSGRKNQST